MFLVAIRRAPWLVMKFLNIVQDRIRLRGSSGDHQLGLCQKRPRLIAHNLALCARDVPHDIPYKHDNRLKK